MKKLTHVTNRGETKMVDVSGKPVTLRRAVASGKIALTRAIADAIRSDSVAKGPVLETARIGAIQAAKKTSEMIPLCHPISISHIAVDFRWEGNRLHIRSEVTAEAKTGVEMEALTAASVAALIIYDMCKGIDKQMVISDIKLVMKKGGRSGLFVRKD